MVSTVLVSSRSLFAGLAALALLLSPSAARSGEVKVFQDEIERDFPVRSVGQIQITNMRGEISVQGWSLDKIRVKAKRKVTAESPEQAKKLFSALDFRHRELDGDIELSAEYGRGLDIQERLREREHPQTGMEMQVFAPSNLKLRLWGVDKKVSVKNWVSSVDIRTHSGSISVQGVKNGNVSLLCPACSMQVRAVKGSVRCMGGSGEMEVSDVLGAQVYLESGSGAVRSAHVQAEQLYVSKSGPVTGSDLNGHIEFNTQQAPVEFAAVSGFLSGKTTSGSIKAKIREWVFRDKAIIESARGDISVVLPSSFSGELDVRSVFGKAAADFTIQQAVNPRTQVSLPANHLLGRVGDGGELLKVFSERGSIEIKRGP